MLVLLTFRMLQNHARVMIFITFIFVQTNTKSEQWQYAYGKSHLGWPLVVSPQSLLFSSSFLLHFLSFTPKEAIHQRVFKCNMYSVFCTSLQAWGCHPFTFIYVYMYTYIYCIHIAMNPIFVQTSARI